jgi:hypothetical protein
LGCLPRYKGKEVGVFYSKIVAALGLLVLSLIAPYTALATARVIHHQLPHSLSSTAFTFNTGGPVMMDGTIVIRVDGTQQHVGRVGCLADPNRTIPHRTLLRLLRLADSERFFSLPKVIKSKVPNVDLSGKMVSIHTSAGTKTVWEGYGGVNTRFDAVYSALRQAAPFSFTCPHE